MFHKTQEVSFLCIFSLHLVFVQYLFSRQNYVRDFFKGDSQLVANLEKKIKKIS